MEPFAKPMGVGAILDRSFQIYRKHFLIVFTSTLLFLGPAYFLLQYFVYKFSAQSSNGFGSIDSALLENSTSSDFSNEATGYFVLVVLVIFPILLLLFAPPVISSQLHLVRATSRGQSIRFKQMLKNSFIHYGPAVGNSLLFGLMMTGIYVALIIVLVIAVLIFTTVTSIIGVGIFEFNVNAFGSSIILIALAIILYALFVSGILIVLGYFLIRLGFYLAAIFLNHDRNPFKRSWKLTKGNFWRVFTIYLVMTVIFMVLNTQIYILAALIELPLLVQLISALITMLILPIELIAYGVTYLDLLVRTEGTDLEQMLKLGYGNTASPQAQYETDEGSKLGDGEYGEYSRG
ncbi:MAG: hypothetical protein K6T85_14735 [Gorillibacterium sp.]|nr:hypothetical protein [Gorillibacterium sp.]